MYLMCGNQVVTYFNFRYRPEVEWFYSSLTNYGILNFVIEIAIDITMTIIYALIFYQIPWMSDKRA